MSNTRLWGAWAIVSMLWATFYVAVAAIVGDHLAFDQVISEILTPITALLIIGGTLNKIFQGFRSSR